MAESADMQTLARFEREVWPHAPALLRVSRMLTADEHLAEDLAQETLMRAFRRIETFQAGTHMKAWLMTLLRRIHIDRLRHDQRRVQLDSLDAMELEPTDDGDQLEAPTDQTWADPDALLDRFDDDDIEHALRTLPESMRWVLLLLDVERLPVADVAAALDVAEGTVKSRASRARARLREALLPMAHRRGWIAAPAGEPHDAR